MEEPGRRRWGLVDIAGVVIPLAGHLQQMLLWIPLWWLPPGTSVPPSRAFASSVLNGLLTLLAGLVLGGILYIRGKRLAAGLCVFFSLTPVPLALLMVRAVVSARHLHLPS